jgi:hypothetical protein
MLAILMNGSKVGQKIGVTLIVYLTLKRLKAGHLAAMIIVVAQARLLLKWQQHEKPIV